MIEVKCKCNNTFFLYPSGIKEGRRFCNRQCYKTYTNFSRNGLFVKGSELTQEHKNKLSESAKQRSGKNHYKWINDRTKLKIDNLRNDSAYCDWRKRVFNRDKQCKLKDESCEGYRIAHHIKKWADYKELRYDVKNGITLCQNHHPITRRDEDNLQSLFQRIITEEKLSKGTT